MCSKEILKSALQATKLSEKVRYTVTNKKKKETYVCKSKNKECCKVQTYVELKHRQTRLRSLCCPGAVKVLTHTRPAGLQVNAECQTMPNRTKNLTQKYIINVKDRHLFG